MGHISTPKGVDLIIKSPPLTDSERKELSDFIEQRKEQLSTKSTPNQDKRTNSDKKVK